MKIAKTIKSAKNQIFKAKSAGKIIGFVPTMGALHNGHLSLVRAAKKDCDFVVVSIFVNPTQFGPKEDFRKYPRVFNSDKRMLKKGKVDLIFCPSVSEMYAKNFSTYVEETFLSKPLCGLTRPGHFRGVCTVVAKLFNIVAADIAYFGQKDYQQACIIKRMVKDLNFPTAVKVCPTIREKDGLAMSSRNAYLNSEERKDALVLTQSLELAKELIKKGETDAKKIIGKIRKYILSRKTAKVNYIGIVDAESLQCVKKIRKRTLIVLAVYIGKTRLIDNIIIHLKGK